MSDFIMDYSNTLMLLLTVSLLVSATVTASHAHSDIGETQSVYFPGF